jgi:long-subunit fatty acid transport protein
MAAFLLSGAMFAGGILTNTNQSAMYTRMGCRDATLGIDAVYYNPAGLTKLEDGFHFSINNQTIGQTRTITSDYSPPLNDGKYIGEVSAPLFPGIYAVYKNGKWAFSAGFNPIGGGGGATYSRGLPSFEYSISDLVPALSSQGITAYRMNAFFEGRSVFFGYQANISYAINDMISVALGGRYVTAKETYSGYLRDIELQLQNGSWRRADSVLYDLSASLQGYSDGMGAFVAALQPFIDAGQGSAPLPDGVAKLTLQAMELYNEGMTIAQAQATFQAASDDFAQQSMETEGKADLLGDQEVDAGKTGSGFTPIVSVNIQPIDMLNISIKYEHTTKLELTNKTAKDVIVGIDPGTGSPITMFPDGEESRLDIPAMLSLGATLRPIEPLLISTGFHYWFDKSADWRGREELLSSNSWELGIGAEYYFSEKFLVSAGWIMTGVGVTDEYQTDLSHDLPTYNGWSFGVGWDILPFIQFNVGGQYVLYDNGKRNFSHDSPVFTEPQILTETYEKSNWIIGAGVNLSLSSGR